MDRLIDLCWDAAIVAVFLLRVLIPIWLPLLVLAALAALG